jgi:chromosome segregation ATPase
MKKFNFIMSIALLFSYALAIEDQDEIIRRFDNMITITENQNTFIRKNRNEIMQELNHIKRIAEEDQKAFEELEQDFYELKQALETYEENLSNLSNQCQKLKTPKPLSTFLLEQVKSFSTNKMFGYFIVRPK